MGTDYEFYRKVLISRCGEYGQSFSGAIDTETGEGHVFLPEQGDLNLFDTALAKFIPAHNRHRWFRSMLSSQALAVSVIGTMVQRSMLSLLSELQCDDSLPLVTEKQDFRLVGLEYTPKWLEMGKRKSQIDAYAESPGWRLAIECKLTEPDMGHCQMSKDGEPQKAYEELPGYKFCNRVMYNGAAYWRYWPEISDLPLPTDCTDDCPMHRTYQVARNVICAGINQKTGKFDGRGTALLLYDERNPSFQVNGDGLRSYETLKKALKDTSLLRSATWQSLAGLLEISGGFKDLVGFLEEKYGIQSREPE